MPALTTSDQVIARSGVKNIPYYFEVEPITDAAGFAVRRLYPDGTELAAVINRAGEPILRCVLQFVVEPPTARAGVSRVRIHAWLHDRSLHLRRRFPHYDEMAPLDDPEGPTPDSLQRFRRARKPLALDYIGDYLYDAAEDRFTDEHGHTVTTQQMLDRAYDEHLATTRRRFVWRWRVGSLMRGFARQAVWKGQDLLLWGLLNMYDIELTLKQELPDPFHQFKRSEFRRATEEPTERSQFFGFQSSRKSLFTNLVVLAVAAAVVYYYVPRYAFLVAIYRNDALTTAVLVLGFFIADILGPSLLIGVICGLSRLRPFVMFFVRKVKV
jgi:hypothetical protein